VNKSNCFSNFLSPNIPSLYFFTLTENKKKEEKFAAWTHESTTSEKHRSGERKNLAENRFIHTNLTERERKKNVRR
jgi:hypothetical protein